MPGTKRKKISGPEFKKLEELEAYVALKERVDQLENDLLSKDVEFERIVDLVEREYPFEHEDYETGGTVRGWQGYPAALLETAHQGMDIGETEADPNEVHTLRSKVGKLKLLLLAALTTIKEHNCEYHHVTSDELIAEIETELAVGEDDG